jgi:YD repeat-containing protein
LTVTAGSNTYLDDFVVIPNAARVSFQTTRPLAGITSQSDDRGNSVVYTYDGLGRRFQTFDRNRNMVEQVDYSFEKDNKPYLLAGFTANTTAFKHGVATTFNAPLQCASSPTYDWTFTDAYGNQSFATGASVVKTFGSIGLYTAKLTVSAQGYQSATFIDPFCVVLPDNITGSITVSPNNENNQCDPNNELTKTFTANLNASLDPTLTVVYEWFISNSYGEFVPATLVPNATVNGNVLVYLSPLYSYTAKCVVNVSGSISGGRTDCSITQALATAFSVITFTPNNNCP